MPAGARKSSGLGRSQGGFCRSGSQGDRTCRTHHGCSLVLANGLGFRHRRSDMMTMTAAVMVRIALVAIGRNLIAIAIGMADLASAIGIDTDDRFHSVRDRSDPEGQEHGQTGKEDGQSMHLNSL